MQEHRTVYDYFVVNLFAFGQLLKLVLCEAWQLVSFGFYIIYYISKLATAYLALALTCTNPPSCYPTHRHKALCSMPHGWIAKLRLISKHNAKQRTIIAMSVLAMRLFIVSVLLWLLAKRCISIATCVSFIAQMSGKPSGSQGKQKAPNQQNKSGKGRYNKHKLDKSKKAKAHHGRVQSARPAQVPATSTRTVIGPCELAPGTEMGYIGTQ